MGKKTALLGMLLALGLICGYIECLIPFSFGIMGMKLGLANVVIMLALYTIGVKEAFCLSISRILLSGLLFGNAASIIYSFTGGVCSFALMCLLKKYTSLSIVSVSAAAGIMHNFGQLLAAVWILKNRNIMYYMTVLFFTGLVTGILIGILSTQVILHLQKMKDGG